MITDKELKRVNKLREKKSLLESMLRSFDSEYVALRVGLVDINSTSRPDAKPSDFANFFHNEMAGLEATLTDVVEREIIFQIAKIDFEINQYIIKE